MIHDFINMEAGAVPVADVCIVGTGVAGLTLAHDLLASGKRILILEAGGRMIADESQAFYMASIIGQSYLGHEEGRFRVYGGTSTRWGGQLLPLDPQDFKSRDDVAHSGWPLSYETLVPFYERALQKLRADDLPYDHNIWPRLKLKPLDFDEATFRYRYSKWIPFKYRNLALAMDEDLAASKQVNILLNAAVTRIQLDATGQTVSGLEIRSSSGNHAIVRARRYVLCCGAIETARLMLASNDVNPRGVGNNNDLVGRYFQDHISINCADLKPAISRNFIDSFSPFFIRDVMHSPRLELRPEAAREMGCLTAFGQVLADPPDDSGFIVVREILRRMQAKQGMLPSFLEVRNVLRELPYVMRLGKSRYLGGRLPYPPRSTWRLAVDVEQEPRTDSRITLSRENDAFGMPVAEIDWRVGERERTTAMQFVTHFREQWTQLNLGDASWEDSIFEPGERWLGVARDTYHQAGTTRMGDDPTSSVVDTKLRVHGIDNLYIGSTSVFPTSGSANPTFTMVALCLRLADDLRRSS